MRPFDSNSFFRPDSEGIRHLAIRGAGVTVFSGGLGLGIQIIATVVLARLLTPTDFGLVAMVTTFSLLLTNFGLNGFTEAIIQKEELTEGLAVNFFWISITSGVALSLVFAASGRLLGKFYNEPRVVLLCEVASLTIFITSTSVVHLALLKRAMKFTIVSASDVMSRLASVIVSIAFAFFGYGYWALLAGLIAQPLVVSVAAWSQCIWLPSRPRKVIGTAAMFRFSMHVYGRFGLNYFARNMDNLLVGWKFEAQALGFYKKAYDLFALSASQLVAPLTVVAVAGLSRFETSSLQYRKYLLSALGVVAFVAMGLGADLTFVGKDIIRMLLGPRWGPAGQIFTFFGPGIGLMILYGTHGWVHLSIGRADRWFRWGIVEFIVTGLLFLMALPYGPTGIAAAWTISFWILILPAFWYAGRPIQMGIGPVVSVVWRYLVASVMAGSFSLEISYQFVRLRAVDSAFGAFARVALFSTLFGIIYCMAVILLHWSLQPFRRLAGLLREMKKPRAVKGHSFWQTRAVASAHEE